MPFQTLVALNNHNETPESVGPVPSEQVHHS